VNQQATVFIVDEDRAARRALGALVEAIPLPAEAFASADEFLDACDSSRPGCLLLDIRMPGINGLELFRRLLEERVLPPVILVSARGDVPTAVQAIKAGALNFLEKPCRNPQLREAIQEALKRDADNRKRSHRLARIQQRIGQLTRGEREVLRMLAEGKSNKTMATLLGLSVRTIEVRRAKVMRKMKAASLAGLIRLTLLAGSLPTKPNALLDRLP
jgi:two-component system response regulator FixJ